MVGRDASTKGAARCFELADVSALLLVHAVGLSELALETAEVEQAGQREGGEAAEHGEGGSEEFGQLSAHS